MKKIIKNITIISLLFILILLASHEVFASNVVNSLTKMEYSEEYKNWLKLSDEEKQKVMMPSPYYFNNSKTEYKNPLFLTRMLGSSVNSRYSLKETIPTNLVIRNQQQTNSCWAFAALSSLETNLALSNYKSGTNTSKVYDFSERHMEYSSSKTFANGVTNPIGYNRNVGDGGSWWTAEPYFINGNGAIAESEMPFENNENTINISEIQNKTVSSQVYDTIYFENYEYADDAEKTEIMNQIKQHIKNYGSVYALMHGSSSNSTLYDCYNNETGAKYCFNSILHAPDHAVAIIGWDDNYSVDNFAEDSKPNSNGAWIIRNSWGERQEMNLLELKQEIYNTYPDQCNSRGWTEASLIPNEFIEEAGYTIEGDIAYVLVGDNGLMYVSYEDDNISDELRGIVKATDTVDYDNIYQYNDYYAMGGITTSSKVMLGNIFEKNLDTEYLTQVSLTALETYTCRVYVNPNGSSLSKADLQLVPLKAGESETINAGYHTLEFAKPIKLTGDKFAVVIEITSSDYSTSILMECKVDSDAKFDVVKVESGKCFLAGGHDLEKCTWEDLSKLTQANPSLIDGDSTIKAFTTNELIDESLKSIEITTPPTKTSYFEGENFDKTGMVVTAKYNSRKNPSVVLDSSSYSISNGTNLQANQTSVTITYEDKTVNQTISVEKNSVTELKITTPPTKTEYKEGQSFDKTGMVIEATRKNGNKEIVTDYTIEDGNNLKVDQTKVTISYEDKTVEQDITVIPNPLIEIKVDKAPNKTNYVVGQNFDKTGMIITGVYKDESTVEILDYTIENGTNLTKEQTSVTISYLGKTTTQDITVVEKAITGISINKKPTKLTYIQNKEDLDLSGGSITVSYNDETTENVDMTYEQIEVTGFDNKNVGKITITLTYQSKTTTFEIEIIEEVKAENSNLVNAKSDVKQIKAYYFTNNSQEDYTLIEVDVNNIERNLNNDKVEYYYYLSTAKNKENITEWVKITEEQNSNDKLHFTINSKDISNYEDISKENVLYLYIKEVAIKGGNQKVAISNAMSLESDVKVETYVDNAKKENITSGNTNLNTPSDSNDDTVANGKLPNAGTAVTVLIAIFIIVCIAVFLYSKYKDLSKYVK